MRYCLEPSRLVSHFGPSSFLLCLVFSHGFVSRFFHSWLAGDRGPGCASDRHIRGVLARVSRPGILILAFMISTFNCAPETRSKHARPVCVFHDMLWSRVSSCGLLALEEVVSVPDICNVLSRLFCGDKQRSGKDGPNPFGDFRGRPH